MKNSSDEYTYIKKIKSTVPKASYNRIEERYAKYVKNKDSKPPKNKEPKIAVFDKEQKTYNDSENSFGIKGRDDAYKISKSFNKDDSI